MSRAGINFNADSSKIKPVPLLQILDFRKLHGRNQILFPGLKRRRNHRKTASPERIRTMFFINIVILVTHINVLKLRCSHGMIHMSVRHKNNNRLIGQLLHAGLQTSDSASRINQHCLFRALHQIHQLGCERINSGNSLCYFFCSKNKTLIHCPVFSLFPYFSEHIRYNAVRRYHRSGNFIVIPQNQRIVLFVRIHGNRSNAAVRIYKRAHLQLIGVN